MLNKINAYFHAIITHFLIRLFNDKVSEVHTEYVKTVLNAAKYDAHLARSPALGRWHILVI